MEGVRRWGEDAWKRIKVNKMQSKKPRKIRQEEKSQKGENERQQDTEEEGSSMK